MDDREMIRIAEAWDRGEITEDEARDQLGDDMVDRMIDDREAMRDAMDRETSEFFRDE
jgi:hypothetical protein